MQFVQALTFLTKLMLEARANICSTIKENRLLNCRKISVFYHISIIRFTAKNTVISPDFLVWKFCGKAQFPQIVSFRKIVTPGSQVTLRYFWQWFISQINTTCDRN